MATSDFWNAPDIVPAITYSDLPRTIEWLERVFGFRKRAEARLTWPGGGMTLRFPRRSAPRRRMKASARRQN